SLIGSLPSVVIFTLLAAVELVVDKLPSTARRTAAPGLIARIVTGALTGACVAVGGGEAWLTGSLLGSCGAIVGCFGGYQARKRIVKAIGKPDLYVALIEDFIALAGCLWVVSRF